MAQTRTKEFKTLAAETLGDDSIQKNLRTLYSGFNQGRIQQAAATPNWEELRERARRIKAHTIENLDHYLNMAAENVEKAGGKIFFAKDSDAATKYVLDLAKQKGVRSVIKGKSMLSEEMDLNHHLAKQEIEAVETDLGEYLVQLAGQTPYHIIGPAIHMSKSDVNELFHENLGTDPNAGVEELASAARNELREKFIQADMGITGANFVVAETGTLVLVTNEGQRSHVHFDAEDSRRHHGHGEDRPVHGGHGDVLRLLIRSATGQRISSYVTMVTGPRSTVEEDGPDEFHLVIVDNGRSKLLADPHLREALYCIRCGACLNACPVYRKVGGHSYGWVYSGPIGAVVSPVLTNVPNAKDLPYASSLCGACKEACPIKIDLPRMLLYLRSEVTEGNTDPGRKKSSPLEKLAMKAWKASVSGPAMLRLAGLVGRIAQLPFRQERASALAAPAPCPAGRATGASPRYRRHPSERVGRRASIHRPRTGPTRQRPPRTQPNESPSGDKGHHHQHHQPPRLRRGPDRRGRNRLSAPRTPLCQAPPSPPRCGCSRDPPP